MQLLAKFNTQLNSQIVYSDDLNLSSFIPGAIVTNVFSISNPANANPAVNINNRIKCSRLLSLTLTTKDLDASGITRIITHSNPNSTFSKLLEKNKDVTFSKRIGNYRAYDVNKSNDANNSNSICNIPPTQKKTLIQL
jgi:hypothetical protein